MHLKKKKESESPSSYVKDIRGRDCRETPSWGHDDRDLLGGICSSDFVGNGSDKYLHNFGFKLVFMVILPGILSSGLLNLKYLWRR